MKKTTIILAALLSVALSSCKKEWVCQCTDNSGANTYHNIPNATVKDANNTCNSFEYNNALGYNNCSLVQ